MIFDRCEQRKSHFLEESHNDWRTLVKLNAPNISLELYFSILGCLEQLLQNECPGSPAKRPRLHKIRSTVCVVEKCLFKQVKRLTLKIRLVAFLQTKFRQQRGKTETAETFFLAGRSMMWWAVSRAGAIKFTPEKYKNIPRKYSTDLISWKGTDYIEWLFCLEFAIATHLWSFEKITSYISF